MQSDKGWWADSDGDAGHWVAQYGQRCECQIAHLSLWAECSSSTKQGGGGMGEHGEVRACACITGIDGHGEIQVGAWLAVIPRGDIMAEALEG